MNKKRLIVDGYNVLHAWGWMAGGTAVDGLVVRSRLVESLGVVHDVEGFDVSVVFDGRERRASRDAGESVAGVDVIFASRGQTADGFIERTVADCVESAVCVVATADRAERETVTALGASCISPEELNSWLQRCRKRASRSTKLDRGAGGLENRLPL